MIGVTVNVKLQKKLAKDSMKICSKYVSQHFSSDKRGLLLRYFNNFLEGQAEMFYFWKDKSCQFKTKKEFSTKYCEVINEMISYVFLTVYRK